MSISQRIIALLASWHRRLSKKAGDYCTIATAAGGVHYRREAAPHQAERARARLVRHVRTSKYLIPFPHPDTAVIESIEVFDFMEVGVVNEPEIWSPNRETAIGVEARISFFDQNGTLLFGPMEYGCWSHLSAPEDEHVLDQSSRTDVPANDMARWFYIALRAEADADAFGFSNKSIVFGDKWRIDQWRLRPGRYLVTARLVGQNVDQTFWFRLEITSGIGVSPLLERATEPVVSSTAKTNRAADGFPSSSAANGHAITRNHYPPTIV